jgi:hypothetical protein
MSLKRRQCRFTAEFVSSKQQYNITNYTHSSTLHQCPFFKMPTDMPSIQAFYKPEVRLHTTTTTTTTTTALPRAALPFKPGEGFTEEELADTLDPLHRKWNPEREYEECSIGQLIPGPRAITFVGRVVNLKTVAGGDKKMPKARGFHSLILRDDERAISVCLVCLCERKGGWADDDRSSSTSHITPTRSN